MKNILFLIVMSVSIISCGSIYIHKEMWRFDIDKPLSEMKTSVNPKLYGYYALVDESGFVQEIMIFYNNGYFSGWLTKNNWKYIRNERRLGTAVGDWGRYQILNDSLVIQYFINTGVPGAFIFPRYDYTVRETHGKLINDSTIEIYSTAINNYSETLYNKKGINYLNFEKPLVYKFVPCDTLPPSDNWLMKEEKKNKLEW